MTITKQEIFELCREQCYDNGHIFWWDFSEEQLLEFAERLKTLILLKKELNEI